MDLDHVVLESDKVAKVVVRGVEYGLEKLYGEYWSKIYRFLHSKTKDADKAADLTQDTFESVTKNLHRFKPGKFPSWLYRIALNTFIDHYKSIKNKPYLHSSLDEITALYDAAEDDAESRTAKHEVLEEARHIFDVVVQNPRWRKIYHLAEFQGLTYKKIAEELEIPVGTVMSGLFRTRKLLEPYFKKFKSQED